MDFVMAEDPSGMGSWLLIIGCPELLAHQLRDEFHNVTGPSFATCAGCKHQAGTHFENHDPDSEWNTQIYPERLECGFCRKET